MIVTSPRFAVNKAGVRATIHRRLLNFIRPKVPLERPSLDLLAAPGYRLPDFVTNCPVAMGYLTLLGEMAWQDFPERSSARPWSGPRPAPRAPFAAAFLIKIDRGLRYMSDLRAFLVEHPALVWVLGFELVADPNAVHGFDVEASLPKRRQLGRVLREFDRSALQWMMDAAVHAEYHWGYASGVVVTQLADGTEVVLAELTQTFDQHDVTYFEPLMEATEQRLGRRPRYGALDAAFDAFYVYDYFDQAGGFAAVPFVTRGGVVARRFDADGNPICDADEPMSLARTFINRTSPVVHQRGVWKCPLIDSATSCPVDHAKWPNGGCQITMATAVGARRRYQLDRQSEEFKAVYKQRTATERINSQATELGIERPRLRNAMAIANQNTLLYVLIDLRALQRVRAKRIALHHAA